MNLIQFLAMKDHPSRTSVHRWYGQFNRVGSSLQDEFREGHRKSAVVPETIDAVHQLILQDRHVTYREIETTLDISGISIHSILHEHLTVKKIFFALDPTQIVNRSKKALWSKELLQIYDRGASKHVYHPDR